MTRQTSTPSFYCSSNFMFYHIFYIAFHTANNKKARLGCGLLVCYAYALASGHHFHGDNNRAGDAR
jgi:hypothetical protein